MYYQTQMSILKYFKRQSELSDANGLLSASVNSSAITAANEEAKAIMNRGSSSVKRGRYNR